MQRVLISERYTQNFALTKRPAMTSLNCSTCSTPLEKVIYSSGKSASLTSLCRIAPVNTLVYQCEICTHLQTPTLDDLKSYYQENYEILIASEEDDQIYEFRNFEPVFRTAHQAQLLASKVDLGKELAVLDYGCAKSSTMRSLTHMHPHIRAHAFDVSNRYIPFWSKFLHPDNWAVEHTPAEWQGRFDLITSFFSLEHIPDLESTFIHIQSLLRPGGVLYAVVPYVFSNIADLIVIDHCNHFTPLSFAHIASRHLFAIQEIDLTSHRGAMVVRASKGASQQRLVADPEQVSSMKLEAARAAEFWKAAGERVRAFENSLPIGTPVAIYGAGFYGAFIASHLERLEDVFCHLDQNPHLLHTQFNGRKVMHPSELPRNVRSVLVGLNPQNARSIIASIPAMQRDGLTFFFL